MTFEKAERLKQLPPYLFQEIDRLKAELIAKGVDVINLGVGDPDLPTPRHIIEKVQEAVEDPSTHQYPSYSGMNDFRISVAGWYQRRFGVELDPLNEVVTLIGSKEGIAHFPLAFINPGDLALVPTPAYPVYHVANALCRRRILFHAAGAAEQLPSRSRCHSSRYGTPRQAHVYQLPE